MLFQIYLMKYVEFYPRVRYPFIVCKEKYCCADKIKSGFHANKNKTALTQIHFTNSPLLNSIVNFYFFVQPKFKCGLFFLKHKAVTKLDINMTEFQTIHSVCKFVLDMKA